MKNNKFFDELEAAGRAFEEAKAKHEELKQKIVDTYGWGSDELKAWYNKKEELKDSFPYSSGECKAYRAWKYSEREEVEMNDSLWEDEIHDFVEAFRKAGIDTFVITNTSTGLMENLHRIAGEGCTMQGLCTIEKDDAWFGKKKEVPGIRFSTITL